MRTSHRSYIPPAPEASYPVRPGNRVRVLVDGNAAFGRIAEAVDRAEHSLWVTVAFLAADFRFPASGRSFFDLLDDAVRRGVDVRALFWRHNSETAKYEPDIFSGNAENRTLLATRSSRFNARWDQAPGPGCHHQKSWVIDLGHPAETTFVGGMNLNPANLGSAAHRGDGDLAGAFHDVYVELTGPSAADVGHNFAQRWNGASERAEPNGTWGPLGSDDLTFPASVSEPRGNSAVQIQRAIPPSLYEDGTPSPACSPFRIQCGERSIRDQYLQAIQAARSTIYIENQSLLASDVVRGIWDAVDRGVSVAITVPLDGERMIRTAREWPEYAELFATLADLGAKPNFTMAGLARVDGGKRRTPIHVHSKLMTVDDQFATIGSCNLRDRSFDRYTELNASIWDPQLVTALRTELFDEHLGQRTGHLRGRSALAQFRRVAQANRASARGGKGPWTGLTCRIDPAEYGVATLAAGEPEAS